MKLEQGNKKAPQQERSSNQPGNNNMHYFKFNIGDYAKATRHLNNLEDLAYRRLIELYYDTEKPLPNDVKKLARLINMRENIDEIEVVLCDFFKSTDDGFQQKRIDEEIASYHQGAETARANGKKGGRPKKPSSNPKKTQPVNLANPDETGLKANQEPLTINQEPLTNNKDTTAPLSEFSEEIFNQWWVILPSGRKQAKNKCLPKWKKLTSKKPEDEIIRMAQGIANYLEYHAKENTPVNYIKQPIKMLNDEIWNDE